MCCIYSIYYGATQLEHDVRKLMKLGASSTALIIPKKWLNDLRLGPGSLVDVFFDGTSITVVPRREVIEHEVGSKDMQIFVDLKEDGVEVAAQEIVAAYVEGATRIRVRGDETDIAKLMNLLNNFITGFIIVSRGKSFYDVVVSEFYVDPKDLVNRSLDVVATFLDMLKGDSGYLSMLNEFMKLYNAGLRLIRSKVVASPPEAIPELLDYLTILEKLRNLVTTATLSKDKVSKDELEDITEVFRSASAAVKENSVEKALKVIEFCRRSRVCNNGALVYVSSAIIELAEVVVRKCVRDKACRCRHFFPKITQS